MFLDREPYIRVWRPVYKVFGPLIRGTKLFILDLTELFPSRTANHLAEISAHIAKIETDHQKLYSTVEQVLLSILADRQIAATLGAIEERLQAFGAALSDIQNQLAVQQGTAEPLGQVEAHLARTEAGQEQLYKTLEQLLLSVQADRQITSGLAAIDERLHALATADDLRTVLAEKQSQSAAHNAAQWLAIEQLLIEFMAHSSRAENILNLPSGSPEVRRDAAGRTATA